MQTPQSLRPEILTHISQQLQVSLHSLVTTIGLLDDGGTVPFIARYRKEATGNLDEVQIRDIAAKLAYFRELEDRRATILHSIQEQGKLTPELKERIEQSLEKNEIEDLYLPFKPKRRTKATIAREKGLEPLAEFLWKQLPGEQSLESFASTFVNAEKGVASPDEALEGARYIVAEWVSENADLRKGIREMMARDGSVVSHAIEGVEDPEGKYAMYADFKESNRTIPSHRMLAIRRGAKEGFLFFEIELPEVGPINWLKAEVIQGDTECSAQLEQAIEDAYHRLLNPSIQTEIRLELKDRADEEAIRVFRSNLDNVLMAPPAGMLPVLALDPGIRTGCKVAIVDDTGKFLESGVIYPLEPRNDLAGSARSLTQWIEKYRIRAIAIGNGTGSREVEAFVKSFLREKGYSDVFAVVVNESGASIYSASDVAREEFPELDLTIRGAISIGRRLQDPLAELVKCDPKSIGVGQYQHDVDQRRLAESLDATVESCVNRVGVDLNTASHSLLRYVAGITERSAKNIVEFRNSNGRFLSRKQLLDVTGFGPKTFEQAAGFLRIRGGANPLDSTAVHPESYGVVERIAASASLTVPELIANPSVLDSMDLTQFKTESVGVFTLGDIKEELRKPGRDPREQFVMPSFRDDVKELTDLVAGMELEGVVTNVTAFGAFVDVGVHQDGLVHISELTNRYVKDPHEVVRAGQIVKVQVMSVDPKSKRIALSMKALEPKSQGQGKRPGGPPQRKRREEPSVADKLQMLNDRFRTR